MKLKVTINVGKQEQSGKWRHMNKSFIVEISKEQIVILRMDVEPAGAFSLGEKVDIKLEAEDNA